jgi:ferredoxin
VAFEAAPDETIMEAAERATFLAHSCLSGICRACMTRSLRHGGARSEYAADLNIDRFEIEEGFRLLCSAFARTDVELER